MLVPMMWSAEGDEIFDGILATIGDWDEMVQVDPTPLRASHSLFVFEAALALVSHPNLVFDVSRYWGANLMPYTYISDFRRP